MQHVDRASALAHRLDGAIALAIIFNMNATRGEESRRQRSTSVGRPSLDERLSRIGALVFAAAFGIFEGLKAAGVVVIPPGPSFVIATGSGILFLLISAARVITRELTRFLCEVAGLVRAFRALREEIRQRPGPPPAERTRRSLTND